MRAEALKGKVLRRAGPLRRSSLRTRQIITMAPSEGGLHYAYSVNVAPESLPSRSPEPFDFCHPADWWGMRW